LFEKFQWSREVGGARKVAGSEQIGGEESKGGGGEGIGWGVPAGRRRLFARMMKVPAFLSLEMS